MTNPRAAALARLAAACAVLALAAGCANLSHMMRTVEVQQPMTARPAPPQLPAGGNGGIFQPTAIANGVVYQPLFEDRRARSVGDTLTVVINESINASKQASSTADRTGSTKAEIASITTPSGYSIKGGAVAGGTAQTFEGKGDSSAKNVITGSIAVSVIEVLQNGNLVVSGEKQIGINQGSEFIRLSGVVNPVNITFGNVVSSTQIADARLEYRGTGYIDEAQTMGWAQRVLQSILPF